MYSFNLHKYYQSDLNVLEINFQDFIINHGGTIHDLKIILKKSDDINLLPSYLKFEIGGISKDQMLKYLEYIRAFGISQDFCVDENENNNILLTVYN